MKCRQKKKLAAKLAAWHRYYFHDLDNEMRPPPFVTVREFGGMRDRAERRDPSYNSETWGYIWDRFCCTKKGVAHIDRM